MMIDRSTQTFPDSEYEDLASGGIDLTCPECESSKRKIAEAIKLLHLAFNPTNEFADTYPGQLGWMKGNVSMALLYLGETQEKSFHHGTTILELEKTVEKVEAL